MGEHYLLLRGRKRDFESIRRPVQFCSLIFISTYLSVFMVAKVRQSTKEHCAFTKQRVDILLREVLVKAGH